MASSRQPPVTRPIPSFSPRRSSSQAVRLPNALAAMPPSQYPTMLTQGDTDEHPFSQSRCLRMLQSYDNVLAGANIQLLPLERYRMQSLTEAVQASDIFYLVLVRQWNGSRHSVYM